MTNQKPASPNNSENNEGLDIHWELRIKLSPPVKKLIATAIEVGTVTIKIGKVVTPWIAAGSIFLSPVEHSHLPSTPPDSLAKPLPWSIEQSQ